MEALTHVCRKNKMLSSKFIFFTELCQHKGQVYDTIFLHKSRDDSAYDDAAEVYL